MSAWRTGVKLGGFVVAAAGAGVLVLGAVGRVRDAADRAT
jgi:hypothetical protein